MSRGGFFSAVEDEEADEEVDVDVGDGRVSEVVEVNLGGKAAKEEVVRLLKMELTLHFRMTQ